MSSVKTPTIWYTTRAIPLLRNEMNRMGIVSGVGAAICCLFPLWNRPGGGFWLSGGRLPRLQKQNQPVGICNRQAHMLYCYPWPREAGGKPARARRREHRKKRCIPQRNAGSIAFGSERSSAAEKKRHWSLLREDRRFDASRKTCRRIGIPIREPRAPVWGSPDSEI